MSTSTARDVRWCAECRDERPFETPPCEDGHGRDCLDLACVDCGLASVGGVLGDERVVGLELAAA